MHGHGDTTNRGAACPNGEPDGAGQVMRVCQNDTLHARGALDDQLAVKSLDGRVEACHYQPEPETCDHEVR